MFVTGCDGMVYSFLQLLILHTLSNKSEVTRKMQNIITRKEFIRNSAKYAAGITAGIGAMGLFTKNATGAPSSVPDLPWPYVELDPEEARKLGHQGYYSGRGCSYGAFHAIIQLLKEEVGEPYTLLPTEIMEWGKGGSWGWGTLCGALIGGLTGINVCQSVAKAQKLGNELTGWYSQTEFPTDISNQYAVEGKFYDTRNQNELIQTMCGSPLCHISVSAWCAASGVGRTAPERSERCGRLTGDVAAYAVQIMNDELNENFTPLYSEPETVGYCMTCHGPTAMNDTIGKMECVQCHGDHTGAVSVGKKEGFAPTYKLDQNFPNPFNPTTNIRFTIPTSAAVYLAVYDIHGRLVKNLIDLEQYNSGVHMIAWDGTNNYGQRVSSGTYFYRLQAGDFAESKRMMLVK
jgi:hypothetical protein